LNLPERNETREGHYSQIYDFHPDSPPVIRPLPNDQIEEPDMLIEDYNQTQDIRQAASESHPGIQQPEDAEPTIVSSDKANTPMPGAGASPIPMNQSRLGVEAGPIPTNQSHRPTSPVYGDDDPFIYMQDDSQLPSQAEQKGEAVLQDDETSQDYPLLQPSAISDFPTNVIEDRGDDDAGVIQFPISSTPIEQARSRDYNDEEDETAENQPSHLSPRPYGVPPWGNHPDTLRPPGQTFNEEEDQLPAFPEPSAPMHVPQAMPLPMPRAQSKPLTPTARPQPPRTGGQMQQQVPTQKSTADSTTRSGSRISPSARSRPASQPVPSRGGPTRPKSAVGTSTRRTATRNRPRRPNRLYLVLASIAAILVILFAALYLNTASTVQITVVTQDYASSLKLTLSNTSQPGTVRATLKPHNFTKTAPEPATGTTMQATNYAKGNVFFTNTGTVPLQVPSKTIVATTGNIDFMTTANALILPQGQSANAVPVPIQASIQGVSGNVLRGSITVIPSGSLASIAQAQTQPVSPDSLRGTLTVTNPDPTTGGEAHQVAAVTQQDLDNAKKDLDTQVQADINAWQQQNAVNGLVAQPIVTNEILVNPPAVDTPAPDKTFSASINVTATILVARLDDVQRAAVSQLNGAIQADKRFGSTFAIIGNWQTISIDLAQQKADDGKTVTVPAKGKVGPNLNTMDLQNSIKGKSRSDARTLLRQTDQRIQNVDIQTQPDIFWWVSPWADHIDVIIRSAT
jgi:hypothetical protein